MASDTPNGSNIDPPTTPTTQRSSILASTPSTGKENDKNGTQDRVTADESGNGDVLAPKGTEDSEEDDDEDSEDDNGDTEDEPKLKYQRLTASLSTLYRNGDASSCFFVGGDKIVSLALHQCTQRANHSHRYLEHTMAIS